jgi:hypothetical protein
MASPKSSQRVNYKTCRKGTLEGNLESMIKTVVMPIYIKKNLRNNPVYFSNNLFNYVMPNIRYWFYYYTLFSD